MSEERRTPNAARGISGEDPPREESARNAEQDQEVLEDFKLVTDPSLAYMSLER